MNTKNLILSFVMYFILLSICSSVVSYFLFNDWIHGVPFLRALFAVYFTYQYPFEFFKD